MDANHRARSVTASDDDGNTIVRHRCVRGSLSLVEVEKMVDADGEGAFASKKRALCSITCRGSVIEQMQTRLPHTYPPLPKHIPFFVMTSFPGRDDLIPGA